MFGIKHLRDKLSWKGGCLEHFRHAKLNVVLQGNGNDEINCVSLDIFSKATGHRGQPPLLPFDNRGDGTKVPFFSK